MDKYSVLEKAKELAKALKNTNIEYPIEFNELIVKCNQIIESKTKLNYGEICSVQKAGGGCCE